MKFASILAFAALAEAGPTDPSFNAMEGYTCAPGPKSGWAERGDESCKFVAPVIPPPETVGGLEIGKCYQFSSKNFGGKAFRHRNGEIWVDQKNNRNGLYKADSTWKVIKGLKGDPDTISLQASNFPEFHVRHANWLAFAQPGGGPLYAADGTFKVDKKGQFVQFESVNFPGHKLRHAGFRLKLNPDDGSGLFDGDSSFKPREMPC